MQYVVTFHAPQLISAESHYHILTYSVDSADGADLVDPETEILRGAISTDVHQVSTIAEWEAELLGIDHMNEDFIEIRTTLSIVAAEGRQPSAVRRQHSMVAESAVLVQEMDPDAVIGVVCAGAESTVTFEAQHLQDLCETIHAWLTATLPLAKQS